MAGRGIHFFLRVLFALVLGAVVSIGSLPDIVRDGVVGEHAHDRDHPDSSDIPVHSKLNDLEICHAGLDCMTAATLRKNRTLPIPKQPSMTLIWEFERLEKENWTPQLNLPPPRLHS